MALKPPSANQPILRLLIVGFLAQAGFAMGLTAMSSLFLAGAGARSLGYVYLGTPLIMAVAVPLFTNALGRSGGRGQFRLALVCNSLVAALLFFLLRGATEGMLLLLVGAQLAVNIWLFLLYSSYWNFVDSFFDSRAARQSYGKLAAALSAGFASGGVAVAWGASHFALHWFFMLWAVLSVTAVLLLAKIPAPARSAEPEANASGQEAARPRLQAALRTLVQSPFALLLASAFFLAVVMGLLAEFLYMGHFEQVARQQSVEDPQLILAPLLGKMGALMNVIALFLNLFAFSPLVRRLGVTGSALLLPLLYFACFAMASVHMNMPVALGLMFVYVGFQSSIDLNVQNLFVKALPKAHAKDIRTLLESAAEPLAVATVGVMLLPGFAEKLSLWGGRLPSLQDIGLFGVWTAVLALATALGLHVFYRRALRAHFPAPTATLQDSHQLGDLAVALRILENPEQAIPNRLAALRLLAHCMPSLAAHGLEKGENELLSLCEASPADDPAQLRIILDFLLSWMAVGGVFSDYALFRDALMQPGHREQAFALDALEIALGRRRFARVESQLKRLGANDVTLAEATTIAIRKDSNPTLREILFGILVLPVLLLVLVHAVVLEKILQGETLQNIDKLLLISGHILAEHLVDWDLAGHLESTTTVPDSAQSEMLLRAQKSLPLWSLLRNVQEANGLTYVYVFSPDSAGNITYWVDGSPDGAACVPGQKEVVPLANQQGILQAWNDGKNFVSDVLLFEEWGFLKVSAVPISDSLGNVKGLVGADMEISAIRKQTRALVWLAVFLSLGSLLVGLVMAWYTARQMMRWIGREQKRYLSLLREPQANDLPNSSSGAQDYSCQIGARRIWLRMFAVLSFSTLLTLGLGSFALETIRQDGQQTLEASQQRAKKLGTDWRAAQGLPPLSKSNTPAARIETVQEQSPWVLLALPLGLLYGLLLVGVALLLYIWNFQNATREVRELQQLSTLFTRGALEGT